MTSSVSALSGIVANGHQAIHFVSSAPSKIPYGGFSPVKCGAPHFTGYVAKIKMWCRGPEGPFLLGFSVFYATFYFGSYKVLRKPITPFRCEGLWAFPRSGASQRAKALAFILRSLSA